MMATNRRRTLDPNGCAYFAAKMVALALVDALKGGKYAREAAEFLWTDRAELFMDAAGYDPARLRELMSDELERRFALA